MHIWNGSLVEVSRNAVMQLYGAAKYPNIIIISSFNAVGRVHLSFHTW